MADRRRCIKIPKRVGTLVKKDIKTANQACSHTRILKLKHVCMPPSDVLTVPIILSALKKKTFQAAPKGMSNVDILGVPHMINVKVEDRQ
jgi:hypothetical protein